MNRHSGIYYIENKITGKKYIGQSAELDKREYAHFRKLNNGSHWNPHLQRAYNKYGKDAFEFKIILYAEPAELTRYEQTLVDRYNLRELYNIRLNCVGSNLGVRFSEEHKRKISIANSGENHPNYGKPAWNKGKHFSEETKRKMGIAQLHRSEEHKRKISIALKKSWVERKRLEAVV